MGLDLFISLCTLVFSGVVSWFIAKNAVKTEINKINKDFSIILLNKRLSCYPELWKIISDVYGVKKISGLVKKGKGVEAVLKNRDEIRIAMKEWRKEYGIYLSRTKNKILFITIDSVENEIETSSLRAFQELEEALFLKEKYSEYDEDKVKKIDKYRNVLMLSLQYDIGLMEMSDSNLKKII